MTDRKPKRPRDTNQLAKRIVDVATGEAADNAVIPDESPQPATGRSGGLKGGPARAAKLSPERKREIARAAASARWANDGRDSDT